VTGSRAALSAWLRRLTLAAVLAATMLAGAGLARDARQGLPGPSRVLPATGTVQVAFTPGDPVDQILISIIDQAKRQVLVQAFSFTHKGIARALVDATRRGVRVEVMADGRQDRQLESSVLDDLARNRVPVYIAHARTSAHNKVIVVDPGTRDAVLVTGSYNFTIAAQRRNAENIVVMRGNPAVVDAYLENWNRHRLQATPFRARRLR